MKCFKCCCITIIVLFVLVVGGSLIALNVLTPDSLGIADEEMFDGKTLRDMGLADKTLMECVTAIAKLMTGVPESEAVTNGYTSGDLTSAEDKISASGDAGSGTAAQILFEGAGGGISVSVNVTDKEVAALVNDYIVNGSGEISQTFDQLEESGVVAALKEITIKEGANGAATISTVIKMDLSGAMQNSPEGAQIPVTLPENLYVAISVPVAMDGSDVISDGMIKVTLPGLDKEFSEALGEMLAGEMGEVISSALVDLLNNANVTGFGNGTITFSPLA